MKNFENNIADFVDAFKFCFSFFRLIGSGINLKIWGVLFSQKIPEFRDSKSSKKKKKFTI